MPSEFIPFAAFLGIGLGILLIGQILISLGRSKTAAGIKRQPLVFGPLTGLMALLLPSSKAFRTALDREVKQAGYYHPRAVDQFLAIRNSLVIGWLVVVGGALAATHESQQTLTLPILIAGLVVVVLLYAIPRLVLQSAAARRVQRIQVGLPDALDMIMMCLTGGLPLQPALERVGSEIRSVHPDLGLELEIVRRQAEAYTMEHALEQFADRTDVPEIKSLAALVNQTERLGTNVATALRDYADSMRRGFRQRAEERGNKNSVKMLLPVALCLAPPVYIYCSLPPPSNCTSSSPAKTALAACSFPPTSPRSSRRLRQFAESDE